MLFKWGYRDASSWILRYAFVPDHSVGRLPCALEELSPTRLRWLCLVEYEIGVWFDVHPQEKRRRASTARANVDDQLDGFWASSNSTHTSNIPDAIAYIQNKEVNLNETCSRHLFLKRWAPLGLGSIWMNLLIKSCVTMCLSSTLNCCWLSCLTSFRCVASWYWPCSIYGCLSEYHSFVCIVMLPQRLLPTSRKPMFVGEYFCSYVMVLLVCASFQYMQCHLWDLMVATCTIGLTGFAIVIGSAIGYCFETLGGACYS